MRRSEHSSQDVAAHGAHDVVFDKSPLRDAGVVTLQAAQKLPPDIDISQVLEMRARHSQSRRSGGWRAALGWTIMAGALAGAATAVMAQAQPRENTPVKVMFAPWLDSEEIVDRVYRAGGYVIGARDAQNGVTTALGSGQDFLQALPGEGAWLVLDSEKAWWLSTMRF